MASETNGGLGAALDRMSDRERKLVLLTAGVAIVLVGGLLVTLTQGALESKSKRVELKQEQLTSIQSLEEQYKTAEADEKRALQRLQTNTTSLFSHLQKTAAKLGLSLSDLAERQLPVKDTGVTEVTVDVNLKSLSVDKLTQFLEEIEGADKSGLIKITKLKVKTRHDAEDLLDVTLTVATWKKS
jgi:multidrug efflux pump subunit AcrB